MLNSNKNKFDVIIIGAGVVGCYAAGALAQLGYEVCVLEKNAEADPKAVALESSAGNAWIFFPQAEVPYSLRHIRRRYSLLQVNIYVLNAIAAGLCDDRPSLTAPWPCRH